jgi:hypothetical protein
MPKKSTVLEVISALETNKFHGFYKWLFSNLRRWKEKK